MKEIIVKSSEELLKELTNYKDSTAWIFRGQQDATWKLIPKIGRNEYSKFYSNIKNEILVFQSWKRYAIHFIDKEPNTIIDWLTLAQHYGLATRLLDWTKNPLNAAFFAVHNNFNTESAIFCLEVLNKEILDESEEDPFKLNGFRVCFPKGMAARILSQRGIFTISDKPHVPLEEIINTRLKKIIIDKAASEDIDETLRFFGISELSIFQDLTGLSDHLNAFAAKQNKTSSRFNPIIYDLPQG